MLFKFTQIGGVVADAMRKSMETEKILLNNDVLLAAVYVNLMSRVTLTNNQQEKRKKTLVAIALGMKEDKERNSKVGEVDESQNFSKGKSSTSGSDNEDFEHYLDQQAKRGKTENKKRLINSPSCNSLK